MLAIHFYDWPWWLWALLVLGYWLIGVTLITLVDRFIVHRGNGRPMDPADAEELSVVCVMALLWPLAVFAIPVAIAIGLSYVARWWIQKLQEF